MTKVRLPLKDAEVLSNVIVKVLEPFCHRVEVAGSVRRKKETVGDIEIVCEPVIVENPQVDLFGKPQGTIDVFDDRLKAIMKTGLLELHPTDPKNGQRYKKLWCPKGVQVDLFIVRPPSCWGVIFTLRTGPSAFNIDLVTRARELGMRVNEGQLEKENAPGSWIVIKTPEEKDLFEALGLNWIPPEARK